MNENIPWLELFRDDTAGIRAALEPLTDESRQLLASLSSWLSHLEYEELELEQLLKKIYGASHLCIDASEVPEALKYLTRLEWLELTVEGTLDKLDAKKLPANLITLYIDARRTTMIHLDGTHLTELVEVEIKGGKLVDVQLSNLEKLSSIRISGTSMRTCPAIGTLVEDLRMPHNPFLAFPIGSQVMPDLKFLDLRGTASSFVVGEQNPYPELMRLDVSHTAISEFPSAIYGWGKSLVIDFSHTCVANMPPIDVEPVTASRIDLFGTPYSEVFSNPGLSLEERKRKAKMSRDLQDLNRVFQIRF